MGFPQVLGSYAPAQLTLRQGKTDHGDRLEQVGVPLELEGSQPLPRALVSAGGAGSQVPQRVAPVPASRTAEGRAADRGNQQPGCCLASTPFPGFSCNWDVTDIYSTVLELGVQRNDWKCAYGKRITTVSCYHPSPPRISTKHSS